MDQFEEMSRKKQVVHVEKSGRGASRNRTIYRLYNNLVVQAIPVSSVAMKVLPESLVGELQVGKWRMRTAGFVSVLFTNVPMGHAASDPGPGQQQRQRR